MLLLNTKLFTWIPTVIISISLLFSLLTTSQSEACELTVDCDTIDAIEIRKGVSLYPVEGPINICYIVLIKVNSKISIPQIYEQCSKKFITLQSHNEVIALLKQRIKPMENIIDYGKKTKRQAVTSAEKLCPQKIKIIDD